MSERTAHNIMRADADRAINRVIAARMEVFHALADLRLVRARAITADEPTIVALIDAHKPDAP
jgi:hypothetical protein